MDGTIDGRQCRLTIDTGAERTFVRADIVAVHNAFLAPQRLCGVTGHCVQLKGPVEMSIGVGSWEVVLPVYVADIGEPCLLGLDYLTYSQAYVDLGRRKVRVRGRDAFAPDGHLCRGNGSGDSFCCSENRGHSEMSAITGDERRWWLGGTLHGTTIGGGRSSRQDPCETG